VTLKDFDWVTSHPKSDLLKTRPEFFPKLQKEISVLLSIGDIDEDTHQVVFIYLTRVLPLSLNPLCLARDSSKLITQFDESFRN